MDPQNRLSKARLRLLYSFPFFGALVSRVDISLLSEEKAKAKRIPTAGVYPSGKVFFNEAHLAKISDPEVTWTLVHEVLHIALKAWSRQGDRKAVLVTSSGEMFSAWNAAHDYSINLIIEEMIKNSPKKDWLKRPNCLYDEKYTGMCAEAIYKEIIENTPSIEMEGEGDMGEGRGTDEDERDWEDHLRSAYRSHKARMGGELPSALQDTIDDCLPPKLSWHELMLNWVGDNYGGSDLSYRRPSRRQTGNLILPGIDRFNQPSIVILWDTSGSMIPYVKSVVSEIQGALSAYRAPIKVILCDTQVQGIFPAISQAEQLMGNIKGGGGSDFCPAFDEVRNPGSIIIAFTDGEILVPDMIRQQCLWVLTPGGVDPTHGKWGGVIHMDAVD